MNKKLSILICSLQEREEKLNRLLSMLDEQMDDDVEVLVETDNGKMVIGTKRNILVNRAIGDYVAFIDDDDKVSPDYISKVLRAIESKYDCCSLKGEITRTIRRKRHRNHNISSTIVKNTFIHSIACNHWFEKDGIYYRCPNHLNAIKRELVLRVGFPMKNTGEDKDFSLRIFPLLKTEAHISGTIYYYLAS